MENSLRAKDIKAVKDGLRNLVDRLLLARIDANAEAYHRPVAPHDCTGPVVYTSGTHLCLAAPNAMIQEGVRAYYHGWYQDVVTELPRVDSGFVAAPSAPGLGTRLQPDFLTRPGVTVRTSKL
jgi:L-alanine-DL-glutamate epimerase-like enolase superfamily enzyme